jgi:mannosyltransferase OCH1-like enzyme
MGAGLLPRNKAPGYSNGEGGRRDSGLFIKVLVVSVCLLNAYYCLTSMGPSCPKQLLGSGEAAAAAAMQATMQQHGHALVGSHAEQQQQLDGEPAALNNPASTCAVKVEDISSWAHAPLDEPPFRFPKIIHQTVEDKSNVSCESLACMQTWMDMNPGYEHRLVDAQERHEFVATYYPEVSCCWF